MCLFGVPVRTFVHKQGDLEQSRASVLQLCTEQLAQCKSEVYQCQQYDLIPYKFMYFFISIYSPTLIESVVTSKGIPKNQHIWRRKRLIPTLNAVSRFQSDAIRKSRCSGEGEKSLSRGQWETSEAPRVRTNIQSPNSLFNANLHHLWFI